MRSHLIPPLKIWMNKRCQNSLHYWVRNGRFQYWCQNKNTQAMFLTHSLTSIGRSQVRHVTAANSFGLSPLQSFPITTRKKEWHELEDCCFWLHVRSIAPASFPVSSWLPVDDDKYVTVANRKNRRGPTRLVVLRSTASAQKNWR